MPSSPDTHPTPAATKSRHRARIDVAPAVAAAPVARAKVPGQLRTAAKNATKPHAKKKVSSVATERDKRGGARAVAPRPSALNAAAQVLAGLSVKEAAIGLTAGELIERMERERLWSSPSGKTPSATLYAAMVREITARRGESRFKRIAPGKFVAAASATRPARASNRAAATTKPPKPSKSKGAGA